MSKTRIDQLTDENKMYPADPQEIPAPSFWPFILAFGVMFLFWGIITSFIVSLVGVIIMIISIAGWISELRP